MCNPEGGCSDQPKVAVLGYLGKRGEGAEPERVAAHRFLQLVATAATPLGLRSIAREVPR